MSKSAIIKEDSSWAQTFVTVTPQDDGYLREIEDTCVVSGNADVSLNLDSWNIVMRRSLMNTTKDFIDPRELDESYERVTTECQTYLQGFPRVELPIVYRDEATQTLYIGDNNDPVTEPTKAFDDIIAVMNEKPLPKWRKSQMVQTAITCEVEYPRHLLLTKLQQVIDFDDKKKSTKMKFSESKDEATSEALDLVNFVVERTLWMTEPINLTKKEQTDVSVTTVIKYNETTKKFMIDNEIQTSLSCEPKESNSQLLTDYHAKKNFCREEIKYCLENGVYRRIVVDNVIDDIVEESKRQIDFPNLEERTIPVRRFVESSSKKRPDSKFYPHSSSNRGRINNNDRSHSRRNGLRLTKDILLADDRAYVTRMRANEANDSDLEPACWRREESSINESEIGRRRFNTSSESEISLTLRDEEALGILRNTFCKCSTQENSTEAPKYRSINNTDR